MIYCDIDGVVRYLAFPFGGYPDTWDAKIYGISFVDYIKQNPQIYLLAPPTEYGEVIAKYYINNINKISFLSTLVLDIQKEYTKIWFMKNYKFIPKIIWVKNQNYKLKYLNFGVLIDDYPYLEAEYNKKIYIISRPYNLHINALNRIKNKMDLEKVFKEV